MVHHRLLRVPVAIALDLVPFIRFDGRNGRRDGGLLGYRGVARRLMYIMNMMYAMYIKDIKI